MNNQYHCFTRIPKGVANATLFDLQRSSYPDALDVFEYLTNFTHHNTFESKMIYQGELLGIQRRLNKILKPHGYRLKACKVPVGIQKAHKVSSNEKRWGFEVISTLERKNQIEKRLSVGLLLAKLKKAEKERKRNERFLCALDRLKEMEVDGLLLDGLLLDGFIDNDLLNEFLPESELFKGFNGG